MKINVFLDIDGVLACHNVRSHSQARFFKNKGAVLTALQIYYMFPGVIEFIKVLFQTEGVKVSFFSSGTKGRNLQFVDQILKIALSEEKYNEIRPEICILSRDDLVRADPCLKAAYFKKFGLSLPWLSNQKDLLKGLQTADLLANSVLIDDDLWNIAVGQAKNFLLLPKTCACHFNALPEKVRSYHVDGYKYLRCVLKTEPLLSSLEENPVKKGKQITVVKTDDGFAINFLNKSNEYERAPIDPKNHPELLVDLNKAHEKMVQAKKKSCFLEDENVAKKVYAFVKLLDGRVTKISHKVNRIFYAAGLLFAAIEEAKTKNIPVSEALFQRQFTAGKEEGTFKQRYWQSYTNDALYLKGLAILRGENENLEFVTPNNYTECVNASIPATENVIENILI